MDQGLAIVIATSMVALVYLALAAVNFWRRRTAISAARLFAAILFGGVALFLAFQMRLF